MRPVILTILDGWGYSKQKHGNAILSAQTPNINSIQQNYPSLLIQASGKAAGMTWGEPGNSEVGHLTIGAGRIIFQYLSRIDKAIATGEFFENEVLKKAVEHARANNSTLHLAGLLTSGSVHSHIDHLIALIDLAARNEVRNVKLHLFTDGKDSGLKEGAILVKKVQDHLAKTGAGNIATIIGRDFAMDRSKNWDYTNKTYDLMVRGAGEKTADLLKKLEELYGQDITDSKIPPLIMDEQGLIGENDALIFFNFREDSMRQLTKSFIESDFEIFPIKRFQNLFVASMTQYLEDARLNVAFPSPEIHNGLAEYLAKQGLNQFHIAETEKYAHVTYFFNCLKNEPFDGEVDIFMESEKDHLEKPQMRASDIADKVIESLNSEPADFYVINFANADILSHSGSFEATVKGIEAVDQQIGRLLDAVLEKDGTMLVTADHGNAESLLYQLTGARETKHNDNPVPLYLVGKEFGRSRMEEDITKSMSQASGLLTDIAPTVLALMGLAKPEEMTGESLLRLLQ